ncbi:MAG: VanZ family protein [Gammaproteobacteria bacterium]
MLPLRYARSWLVMGVLILLIGLILTLSPLPSGTPSFNDKVVHATGFFGFMLWFGGLFENRRLPLVALALSGYGVLIEMLQALTPARQAEGLDLVADVAGVLLGWLVCAAGLSRWCTTLESWLVPQNPGAGNP